MPWSTPFDQPILLRGGGKLTTLQHAADYIMELPEDVQQQELWQVAVENLINAAETGGGWLMFARIAMMRALNADGKTLWPRASITAAVPAPSYLSEELTSVNFVLSALPMPLTAVTIRMLMPPAMKADSMAVAAHSSSTNRASNRRIDKLLSTLPGLARALF